MSGGGEREGCGGGLRVGARCCICSGASHSVKPRRGPGSLSLLEFRQWGKGRKSKREVRNERRPQQGSCVAKSHPHPQGSSGRSEVSRKGAGEEAGSKGVST